MIIIVQWTEKGTVNQTKILHDVHRICHSPCTVGHKLCGKMVCTWHAWQSNNMDASPGVRVFNTWTTAMQIAISSELKALNTWFTGKEYSVVLVFFGCLHTQLFVSRTRRAYKQISTATSKTTWLYPSFTHQLSIYWLNTSISHIVIWCNHVSKHLPWVHELSLKLSPSNIKLSPSSFLYPPTC